MTEAMVKQNEFLVPFTIFGLLLLALLFVYARVYEKPELSPGRLNPLLLFVLLAAGAFLMRLLLAYKTPGFDADVTTYKAWSYHVYNGGMANYYTNMELSDYPPFYMYILYILGGVREALSLDYTTAADTLLVKLPSLIGDILLAYAVFRMSAKKLGANVALFLGVLILFNPALIMNSAVWGQVDVIFTLLIVLTFWLLAESKLFFAGIAYALAVLMKPQAFFFAPLIIIVLVFSIIKGKNKAQAAITLALSVGAFVATFFLLSLPFKGGQQPLWIIDKYTSVLGGNDYGTYNAFNLFALIGLNFVDATTFYIAGLPGNIWGYIFMACVCVYVFWLYAKRPEGRFLFALAALLLMGIFMLGHGMHERHMYAAPVLLVLAYIYQREKGLLYAAIAGFAYLLACQSITLYYYAAWIPNYFILPVSICGLALLMYTGYVVTKMALMPKGRPYTKIKFAGEENL